MHNQSISRLLCFALVLGSIAANSCSTQAAMMIVFTGSTGNVNADNGFQMAANYLQSQFTDNVTVTIQRGFASLSPGVLGQAGSTILGYSYPAFRNASINDASSGDDAIYTSSLPVGSFSMYMNRTSENGNLATPYLDNTGLNTTNVQMTSANAKALGLSSFGGTDALITFNSNFIWDFDNTNGITPGTQDFVGVAIHELMHAMGFISNVDDVDSSPGLSSDSYRATPLDFTRHSTASLAAGARIDFTADTRAKYFSLDAGLTNLTPGPAGGFSTGVDFGDGSQASHWKDNLGLGIMDPTSVPAGQANVVSQLDLRALDVIGWNRVVPEPTSLSLLGVCVFLGPFVSRRREG